MTAMRTLKSLTVTLLLFAAGPASAQDFPTFEELQRQMREMQRQMMEQLRNSPFNDPNFAVPQWDTTFQFRFDTTFEGGNMSQFFRFSPFGSDSTLQNGFLDFDRFFGDFFNLDNQYKQPDYGIQDFPKDDGTEQPSDGLLPEERLRRQEESEKAGKKQSKPAEPKPDPKVKTIRI